jgi:hypothetical protein
LGRDCTRRRRADDRGGQGDEQGRAHVSSGMEPRDGVKACRVLRMGNCSRRKSLQTRHPPFDT